MNNLLETPELRAVPELTKSYSTLTTSAGAMPSPQQDNVASCDADDREVARLAALPPLDYERQREKAAKELGCRAPILDKLVDEKREKAGPALQGGAVTLPEIEPWSEPVNGSEVLSQISATFSRYIVLPAGAADVLTLWCAHTHVFNAFICSPRLNISSPEKGCGKTTLRDVVALFVPRPLLTENLSVAVLFRLVDAQAPTILADEYDAWLKQNEELRGLLNAGHRRGAMVYRCEGERHEVRGFAAYCPSVLCGIGALPGTLNDRSIVVRLDRARPGELSQKLDPRRTEPEQELGRKLVRWCSDYRAELELIDPTLPRDLSNRRADNWCPLFALAEVAGGDWMQRVRSAANALHHREIEEDDSIGVKTLSAIKTLFESSGSDRLPTRDALTGLVEREDGPWAAWWERDLKTENTKGPGAKLARLLKAFGIRARTMRVSDETLRGYMIADFTDAWKRYCPITPASDATTQQGGEFPL